MSRPDADHRLNKNITYIIVVLMNMCFERVGPNKMCDENIFSQSQTIFEVF